MTRAETRLPLMRELSSGSETEGENFLRRYRGPPPSMREQERLQHSEQVQNLQGKDCHAAYGGSQ